MPEKMSHDSFFIKQFQAIIKSHAIPKVPGVSFFSLLVSFFAHLVLFPLTFAQWERFLALFFLCLHDSSLPF
jgi:hypothetical protein